MTRDEIARKHGIDLKPAGPSNGFAVAKALELSRQDRPTTDLPSFLCPHCGHEAEVLAPGRVTVGSRFSCPECRRAARAEHITTTVTWAQDVTL